MNRKLWFLPLALLIGFLGAFLIINQVGAQAAAQLAPPPPVETQLDVYVQANLIFLGKASIYLKAMDRPLPKDWKEWIG